MYNHRGGSRADAAFGGDQGGNPLRGDDVGGGAYGSYSAGSNSPLPAGRPPQHLAQHQHSYQQQFQYAAAWYSGAQGGYGGDGYNNAHKNSYDSRGGYTGARSGYSDARGGYSANDSRAYRDNGGQREFYGGDAYGGMYGGPVNMGSYGGPPSFSGGRGGYSGGGGYGQQAPYYHPPQQDHGQVRYQMDFPTYDSSMRGYTPEPAARGGGTGAGRGGGRGAKPSKPSKKASRNDVFRCAACMVDCSGEISFIQHLQGKSHTTKAGRPGFAGLVPNDMGIVPQFSAEVQNAVSSPKVVTATPKKKDEAAAKTQFVGMSRESEAIVRTALMRSASAEDLVASTHSQAQAQAAGRGGIHKSISAQAMPRSSSGQSFAGGAPSTPKREEGSKRQGAAKGRRPPLHSGAKAENSGSKSSLAPPPGLSPPPLPPVSRPTADPTTPTDIRELSLEDGDPPPTAPASSRQRRQPGGGLRVPPLLEDGGPMRAQREGLPVFAYKKQILRAMESSQVVVVEGETGCGKTTQVPQFILDDCAERKIGCNIICTQPRRISAMGVSERVAQERGEPIGTTVGYTIRLESKTSSITQMLFCTTGILLRRLEEDAELQDVSHIFIDEVHERSVESDFLLMVLRDLLKTRKDLRVVLMSATLDADLFNRYFGSAPSIKVPGRTFPVTALFLEDALEVTGHKVDERAEWARRNPGEKKNRYKGGFAGGGGVGQGYAQGRRDRGASNFTHGGASNQGGGDDSWESAFGPAGGLGLPNRLGMPGGAYGGNLIGKLGGAPGSKAASELDDEDLELQDIRERYPAYPPGVHKALMALDHSAINYELIVQVLEWVFSSGGPSAVAEFAKRRKGEHMAPVGAADSAWDDEDASPSPKKPLSKSKAKFRSTKTEEEMGVNADAVLIFLPGLKEIQALQEAIYSTRAYQSQQARQWVLPLHSTVPPEDQRLVFIRPPPGIRKIVLSTNIAETAITIDDVGFVIDCGRMKELRYDPHRRMSSLDDVVVTRANAKQRRGRAGRCKEGAAFHLITRHRHDVVAEPNQPPEVQRVPLEQLVLRIKALKYPGTAADVCAKLPEPPEPSAVQRAVAELVDLDALAVGEDGVESLTPLGVHLSTLPVDVRIGKLILLGAIFGACDECLTIAAHLSYRSPFLSPIDKREEADAAHRQFAVGQSDHLTQLRAYMEWDALAGGEKFNFCRSNFLGIKTLQVIAGLKRQLLELLSANCFVPRGMRARAVEALGRRVDGSDGVRLALAGGLSGNILERARSTTIPQFSGQGSQLRLGDAATWERDTVSAPLLKALLCAALYPKVMTVEYPKPKKGKEVKAEALKFKIREEGSPDPVDVAIHPSSINSKETKFESVYLIFHERVKTTRMYVRDCTPVTPYALMLFGGTLEAQMNRMVQQLPAGRKGAKLRPTVTTECSLTVDGWIKFSTDQHIQTLLLQVRKELDRLLKSKIEKPDLPFGESSHFIEAVISLLSNPH